MRRVASFVVAVVLTACASQNGQKQATSSPSRADITSGPVFAVVRIDDAVDPLADVSDDRLPAGEGMATFMERSMVSGGKVVQIHFMRTIFKGDETPAGACDRFLKWVQTASISLPPGDRFACQRLLEFDPEKKTTATIGVRSYVLTGDAVITQRDVVDAYVGDDKSEEVDLVDVGIKLSPEGRAKLKAATGAWIHRRLAILSDGMIDSSPLVKGEIDTDTLTIAFGERTQAEVDRAQTFVSRLLGK